MLRKLGIKATMACFKDRLVVQKVVYLAQAAGLDLGYYYGWYIRGPYCSAVADDLFAALDDPNGIEDAYKNWSLGERANKKLRPVKNLLNWEGANSSTNSGNTIVARRLELLASVHYLVARKQVKNHGPKTITQKLKNCNKNFTQEEVSKAQKALKSAALL